MKDITQIICTHMHPDHCGAAGKIKEVSGAQIAMGERDASLFVQYYMDDDKLIKMTTSLLASCGVPEAEIPDMVKSHMPMRKPVIKTPPDKKLKSGNKVPMDPFEFRVISTPGHAYGHICLYEPHRKLIFAGDHVLPERFPWITLDPQSGDNPMEDYIHSLKELLKLKVTLAFPGHGPAFSGLEGRINETMDYHERKNAAIRKALADEPLSAFQVTAKNAEEEDDFNTPNIFVRQMSVLDTLAHLRMMRNRAEVNEHLKDGVYYYGL